jgi:hypothetical protein
MPLDHAAIHITTPSPNMYTLENNSRQGSATARFKKEKSVPNLVNPNLKFVGTAIGQNTHDLSSLGHIRMPNENLLSLKTGDNPKCTSYFKITPRYT